MHWHIETNFTLIPFAFTLILINTQYSLWKCNGKSIAVKLNFSNAIIHKNLEGGMKYHFSMHFLSSCLENRTLYVKNMKWFFYSLAKITIKAKFLSKFTYLPTRDKVFVCTFFFSFLRSTRSEMMNCLALIRILQKHF